MSASYMSTCFVAPFKEINKLCAFSRLIPMGEFKMIVAEVPQANKTALTGER